MGLKLSYEPDGDCCFNLLGVQAFDPYGEDMAPRLKYEADARLLAASQTLLDACRKSVDWLLNAADTLEMEMCEIPHPDDLRRVVKDIRAAIAKAEGAGDE